MHGWNKHQSSFLFLGYYHKLNFLHYYCINWWKKMLLWFLLKQSIQTSPKISFKPLPTLSLVRAETSLKRYCEQPWWMPWGTIWPTYFHSPVVENSPIHRCCPGRKGCSTRQFAHRRTAEQHRIAGSPSLAPFPAWLAVGTGSFLTSLWQGLLLFSRP